MSTSHSDPIREAMDRMVHASDPADVVAALARALLAAFGGGVAVDIIIAELPRVPVVLHTERELVATMRTARGDDPIEVSELARVAERAPISSSFGRRTDPIERIRLALRAETVTVMTLRAAEQRLGVVALFGRPLTEDGLKWAELLSVAAGATIARLLLARTVASEIAVRDASIAMLASLSEQSPLPTAFFDPSLRVVVANEAFVKHQGTTHDALFRKALDELDVADLPVITQAIREVLSSGQAVVRDTVAVHPVTNQGQIAAVGVCLIDLSARRRTENAARALADASVVLCGTATVRETRAAVLELGRRWLGAHVALIDNEPPATPFGALLSALPSDRAPSRARTRRVPLAIRSDDLALLALAHDRIRLACDALGVRALVFLPIADAVLCIGRDGADYAAEELALAADVARLASRAFEAAAAREEVRSWSELFADFLGTVSRDLRDPITALVARLYVAQHAANAAEHLPALRKQAERLRDVAQRILDVAPRPPGDVQEDVDLSALVQEESAAAVAHATSRGARVVLQNESDAVIVGDRLRLSEALRDVFAHAADEVPSDGIFCIRVETTPREITITTSHNGTGLTADAARRVFDALWDGRAEGRALTLARAVFAAHGGRSWVETGESSGTAYCFVLPRERELSERAVSSVA